MPCAPLHCAGRLNLGVRAHVEKLVAEQAKDWRSRIWPTFYFLLGGINLADYFYRSSFQVYDLLQGLGFLGVVPLAYLYPEAFFPTKNTADSRPARWARVLSFVGIALVVVGLAIEWL